MSDPLNVAADAVMTTAGVAVAVWFVARLIRHHRDRAYVVIRDDLGHPHAVRRRAL